MADESEFHIDTPGEKEANKEISQTARAMLLGLTPVLAELEGAIAEGDNNLLELTTELKELEDLLAVSNDLRVAHADFTAEGHPPSWSAPTEDSDGRVQRRVLEIKGLITQYEDKMTEAERSKDGLTSLKSWLEEWSVD